MDFYTHEKIRHLEQQRNQALAGRPTLPRARNKPVFAPLASALGSRLRRVGENLECWGNPTSCQPDRPARYRY